MESLIKSFLEDWKKLGVENFNTIQLDNGRFFSPESNQSELNDCYGHLIPQINQKQCFRNSLLASLVIPELEYWQGFYVTDGIPLPLEHAFNVKDGRVFDFTCTKFEIKVVEYWGMQIPREVLEKYMKTEQHLTALEFYLRNFYKKV